MIITIDGPSGTGKSTIAKEVAKRLDLLYVDTGAMFRAVTYLLLEEEISLSDEQTISKALRNFTFDVRLQDGEKRYFLKDRDISKEIRMQRINENVSLVAEKKVVREVLWGLQRDLAKKHSAVFEGRDMGSHVFPEAELKVYLDATPKVRAERRLKELQEKLPEEAEKFNLAEMEKDLLRRDEIDAGRALAPLTRPKKAYVIDSSKLTIEQIVDKIVHRFRKNALRLTPSWWRSSNMKGFYRLIIFSSWLLFKLFYRHKVYGLEHFVRRAAIIAPNHTSYYDPPIAATSWPEELHFLAKESLFAPPIFGSAIRCLNSHPVRGDVSDVAVFKILIGLLKEGKQVILFPEGGRTDGEFGEIKPGIGMLLMRSKAAIIPTYIHGANAIWPRKQKFPKFFGKTACVFGTPIPWESFSHLEKKDAQVAIADCLAISLRKLKEWYDSGAHGIPP